MFFSIIIPSYNREKIVIRAVESILEQNFKDFEIIIVDDGSTDNTEEKILALNNPYINYFKIPNQGVAHARNYGILKSKGQYIGFLDSDDQMEKDHLQTAFDFIQFNKLPEIIHLNLLWGNEGRTNTQKNKLPAHLPEDIFKGCSLHVNCIFIREEIAKKNLFNESRELMFAEDWDLFIKLAVKYKIFLLDKTSVYLIDHADRSMRDFNEDIWINRRDALVKSLENDKTVMELYPHKIIHVSAHMNSLIALKLAIRKQRKKCLYFWKLSLNQNFKELFTKRSAAVLKHLLIP